MKTLKKTLCLVLAVVMVVGALVLPASAEFKDNTSISDDYKTAVTTLETWKIMEGDANGNFKPTDGIQRQEMAAIVYRLLTGDTAGYGKDNSGIYANLAAETFTDVKATDWAAGYIGYCANKGIIVGIGAKNAEGKDRFDPTRNIPNIDVLCMLLRAVGYGMNKEYQGKEWKDHIAADATRLKLTDGLKSKLDTTTASPRQEVAQMTWKASQAKRVTWSDSEKDYIPYINPNNPNSTLNKSLVYEEEVAATDHKIDVWGAPYGGTAKTTNVVFTYPVPAVKNTLTAAVPYPMLWQTWDAVTECDVCHELGIDGEHWAITYTNGKDNKNLGNGNTKLADDAMPFEATDTVNKIGHEGRHTMVYLNPAFSGTESSKNPKYIFVFVDEFLAKVTATWDAVLDPNQHVIRKAGATVTVYSNTTANGSTGTALPGSTNGQYATVDVEGTGYTVGQVLGVHLLTKKDTNILAGSTIVTEDDAAGYGPFTPGSATVTVGSIIKDNDSTGTGVTPGSAQRVVGFVTTTGARYFYDYTFSGNCIDQDDIGKTAVLTLDSQGNVLDYTFVTNAPGYGVTLSAETKQLSINEWVLTYTILLPDGTKTTIDVGQPTTGAPFTSLNTTANGLSDATYYYTNTAGVGANVLVHYTTVPTGKYYVFDQTNLISSIALQDNTIVSGRPAALSKGYDTTLTVNDDPVRGDNTAIAKGTLVDDTTVFFVAEYAPNNVTLNVPNDYNMTGYKVYTGFKNIPNMTSVTGAQLTGGSANDLQNVTVTAFDIDPITGEPKAANDGQVAKYVLVLNAVKQSTPKTINTVNYAYLITNDQFVDVDASTFTYPAIIDGKSGQKLQVKLTSNNPLSKSGLYTYANWTNGEGYSDVYMMDTTTAPVNTGMAKPYNGSFKISKDHYGYADGVLTNYYNPIRNDNNNTPAPNSGDVPYAVAADCVVYLVNPTTGGVTKNALSLLNVDQYAKNCDIWFQLDANGYISLIYMIDNENTANANDPVKKPDPPKYKDSTWTIGLTSDSKQITGQIALYTADTTQSGTPKDALEGAIANAVEVKAAAFGAASHVLWVSKGGGSANVYVGSTTSAFDKVTTTNVGNNSMTTYVSVGDYIVIAWAQNNSVTPTHFAAVKVVA